MINGNTYPTIYMVHGSDHNIEIFFNVEVYLQFSKLVKNVTG